MRVLLIDDSRDTIFVLSHLFVNHAGFEIRAVQDAQQAVAAAAEFRPQAVCLDIMMPEIDGYQVASSIRQIPGLENIVVIALSGNPPDAAKAEAAKIDAHFLKPADYLLLASAILEKHMERTWVAHR